MVIDSLLISLQRKPTSARGLAPARLLFDLVRDADKADGLATSAADSYMQLAIYDLIGALFAPSDPSPVSRHADRLFARIRDIIKDGFADPDFGPREVAAETGISLRYLQKLFTARGSGHCRRSSSGFCMNWCRRPRSSRC